MKLEVMHITSLSIETEDVTPTNIANLVKTHDLAEYDEIGFVVLNEDGDTVCELSPSFVVTQEGG